MYERLTAPTAISCFYYEKLSNTTESVCTSLISAPQGRKEQTGRHTLSIVSSCSLSLSAAANAVGLQEERERQEEEKRQRNKSALIPFQGAALRAGAWASVKQEGSYLTQRASGAHGLLTDSWCTFMILIIAEDIPAGHNSWEHGRTQSPDSMLLPADYLTL